jgi:hypothetical protein
VDEEQFVKLVDAGAASDFSRRMQPTVQLIIERLMRFVRIGLRRSAFAVILGKRIKPRGFADC